MTGIATVMAGLMFLCLLWVWKIADRLGHLQAGISAALWVASCSMGAAGYPVSRHSRR